MRGVLHVALARELRLISSKNSEMDRTDKHRNFVAIHSLFECRPKNQEKLGD
jgi:hypothetical protein